MSTKLIHNVRLPGIIVPDFWVLISDDKIGAVGLESEGMPDADINIDGQGALILPGVIDCHVHFREPGMTHKADIATESRAAVAGGVTSYLEMPNTKPATTTIALWEEKMALAKEKSLANYGFFIGATNDNLDQLKKADYTRVPGVKLFMGSSTGNMLVDDDSSIARIFKEVDAIMAVHAEDQDIISRNTKIASEAVDADGDLPVFMHWQIRSSEACFRSTQRAVALAHRYGRRLHVCHITTEAELALLTKGDPATKLITSEVSPHHLMWDNRDYGRMGARIKMNPSVKQPSDRRALSKALETGLIDMVATDHAPHLLSEKQGGALKAMSGAPLIQFSLPWMLTNFDEETVMRVMCVNPAKIYHIDRRGSFEPGNYADLVLIDQVEPYRVTDADVISRCGWTPLHESVKMSYRVRQTWVNGHCVYDNGTFDEYHSAMPLRFGATDQL